MYFVAVAATAILIYISLWYFIDLLYFWRNPPGPWRIPFFGNFFQIITISSNTHKSLKVLSEKYGDIMSIRLGATDYVVLSDAKIIQNILSRPEAIDRKSSEAFDRNMGENVGVFFANAESSKSRRAFTIKSLRNSGFSRSTGYESVILEEFEKMKNAMAETATNTKDALIHIKPFFKIAAVNIIWKYATGGSFSYDNEYISEQIEMGDHQLQDMGTGSIVNIFPILRKIFPEWSGKNKGNKCINSLHKFVNAEIDKIYKKENTEGDNFVQDFLNKMVHGGSELPENSSSFFTRKNLVVTLLDLFQAGMAGTSTTLNFAIYFLVLNPLIQRKLQDEIDQKLQNSTPSLSDRKSLPYVEATIFEIFRLATIFPVPVPRKIVKDFEYRGYLFRKGNLILSNIYCVTTSKALWGDPENFRPERFLKPNGDLDEDFCENIKIFGHGARRCIGEHLATSTIFLFLVSLLQQMTFSAVPKKQVKAVEPQNNKLVANPEAYKVKISYRRFCAKSG